MAPPVVEAMTELGGTGECFQFSGRRAEADITPVFGQNRRTLTIGVSNIASAVTKLLLENDCRCGVFVGQVYPVIEAIDGVVDRVLRVGECKPGQNDFAYIGNAVAVCVLQIQQVRSV